MSADDDTDPKDLNATPLETGLVRARKPYDVVSDLEDRMLSGHTKREMAQWAERKGLGKVELDHLQTLIRASWAVESNRGAQQNKRDELRAKFMYVYRRALETENLSVALKALDSLGKLDGLTMPEVNIQLAGATADITTRTRERVMQLMEKIQKMSSRDDIIDVDDSGTNGVH